MAWSLKKLSDRVYVLTGSPNTLIILSGGDEALVVDPGIGEGRGEAIRGALEKLGAGRASVVLTHGHSDHLAAAEGLGGVTASRLCVTLVESSVARRALVYGGLVSESFAAMPLVELRVDRVVEPGEKITGPVSTIALPGHTPGHMGVVDEESLVLAAGDAILGERVLERYAVPFASDIRGWFESLSRIEELARAGYTIVPGHGPIVSGERALQMIEANRSAVERVRRWVLETLEARELTLEALAYRATVELSKARVTPRQVYLNRTSLASLLAWLEEENLVEPVVTEEGVAWRRRRA